MYSITTYGPKPDIPEKIIRIFMNVIPYIGNHPWKKKVFKFMNLEAIANVFLNFFLDFQ